jgi:hypothetical protein
MVGPPSRCCGPKNGSNLDSKVDYIAVRSSRCSFYKPEYDAVLKHYGELKETGRLITFKKERQNFVRQSFKVRVPEPSFIIAKYLTSSLVWLRRRILVEGVFSEAQC